MEKYHVCRIAVAQLRKDPSDRSEITSQLLFGERVELLEKTEKWCFVKCLHDQYEGWMDYKQLQQITEQQFFEDQAYRFLSPVQYANILIGPKGTKYYLTPGSTLPYFENGFCHIGDQTYEVTFEPLLVDSTNFIANVEKTAKFYENTPYLWGGRTLFGIDCSGFVQSVYRLNGIQLLRDASMQVDQGEVVDFLAAAKLGDLAFFDNEEGKITHVGLMLSNDTIIHSAGFVRIDPIDDQGIFNAELGKYTHKLRIIKRFVQ